MTEPTNGNVPSLSAALVFATGEVAEVQIAYHKGSLVVIAAGDVEISRTPRKGFTRLQVFPTAKVPA